MRLTYTAAKKFAIGLMHRKFSGSDYKWQIQHFKDVERCALLLAENKNIDKDSLKIASWLHDIGRARTDENHPEQSLKMSKNRFGKISDKIVDCILNHGKEDNPKTEEGRIFRVADKMSLLSPELFLIYAKEDKKRAIKFTKEKIESFLRLYAQSDF